MEAVAQQATRAETEAHAATTAGVTMLATTDHAALAATAAPVVSIALAAPRRHRRDCTVLASLFAALAAIVTITAIDDQAVALVVHYAPAAKADCDTLAVPATLAAPTDRTVITALRPRRRSR